MFFRQVGVPVLLCLLSWQSIAADKLLSPSAHHQQRVSVTQKETQAAPSSAQKDDEFSDEDDSPFFDDEQNNTVIPDPFEPFNRLMFRFNLAADHLLLKPAAQLYQRAPAAYRGMVSHFFTNLEELSTGVADLFAGCAACAFQDVSRFFINMSIGVLGFGDPASLMGLKHRSIDLGLALAKHGVSVGAYLMLPFLGPTSARDVSDLLFLRATDVLSLKSLTVSYRNKILAVKVVSQRAGLLDAEEVMRQTLVLDRYSYIRDAYAQYRFYQAQRLISEKPYFEDPANRSPEWSKKPLIQMQLAGLFSPLLFGYS